MMQMSERSAKGFVVEGLAIVLSILLAFAIDAWWDERHERAEERQVLESLHVEFLANREEAASVILSHESAVQSVAALMELEQDEILTLSAEEVEQHMRFFANPRTFDAVRGSVDALTSAGKLGILRDRELREALTTFVNILDDAVEDRNYLAQTSMTVWSEVARNGGPWRMRAGGLTAEDCAASPEHRNCYINDALAYLPVATPQDLLRLSNNTALMGYVNRNKINAARYASEVRQAEKQIETILKLLEEDL
jgi:hypothetical protein